MSLGPVSTTSADIQTISDRIAAAAQTVIDAWQQDEDGADEELGHGGACDLVAGAIAEVISEIFPDVEHHIQWCEADTHTSVIARLANGIFRIDVPAQVYETGFGYVWRKIPEALVGSEDIVIDKIDTNPDAYSIYQE